jgi:hypothetical protein
MIMCALVGGFICISAWVYVSVPVPVPVPVYGPIVNRAAPAQACTLLIEALIAHRASWPFLDPEFILHSMCV